MGYPAKPKYTTLVCPSRSKRVGCAEQVLTRKSMQNHWFCLEINDFHDFGGDFWRFFLRIEVQNIIPDAGSGHGWLLGHLWKNDFFKNFRLENFSWPRAWFMSKIQRLTTSHYNREPFDNASSWISGAHARKCFAATKNFRLRKFWKIHFFIIIVFDVPEHSQRPEWCVGVYRCEKPQKYHSKVDKSLIFQRKYIVFLVRTSPIETGRSRHAYWGPLSRLVAARTLQQ